jgi:protein phosphatase
MIEFGHGTHAGLRRSRNEDTYYADAGLGLFLVLDGMGGHRYGEVASAFARDGIVDRVTRGMSLIEAIEQVNVELSGRARSATEARPMGTTIAALRIGADGYEAVWVGDSRIYVHRDELHQVSHDHSLVQAMVEAGELDAAQAQRHPQRNVLIQALGVTAPEQLHIGIARGPLAGSMRFLLCTDGLTEEVADACIAGVMARTELAAQECVDQLLLDALAAGARDNVTAILLRTGP